MDALQVVRWPWQGTQDGVRDTSTDLIKPKFSYLRANIVPQLTDSDRNVAN